MNDEYFPVISYSKLPDVLTEESQIYSICSHLARLWCSNPSRLASARARGFEIEDITNEAYLSWLSQENGSSKSRLNLPRRKTEVYRCLIRNVLDLMKIKKNRLVPFADNEQAEFLVGSYQ